VPIKYENINCIRVTPHVYTTLQDLDTIVKAITTIATEKNK